MKDTYDFSKGRRGRVVAEPPPEPGKVRITIRLDEDLIDYFGAAKPPTITTHVETHEGPA